MVSGECGDQWQWRDLNLGTAVAPGLRWRQCQCDISPVTLSTHHSCDKCDMNILLLCDFGVMS